MNVKLNGNLYAGHVNSFFYIAVVTWGPFY